MIQGRPRGGAMPGWNVRPLEPNDVHESAILCRRIHGFGRRRSSEGARWSGSGTSLYKGRATTTGC